MEKQPNNFVSGLLALAEKFSLSGLEFAPPKTGEAGSFRLENFALVYSGQNLLELGNLAGKMENLDAASLKLTSLSLKFNQQLLKVAIVLFEEKLLQSGVSGLKVEFGTGKIQVTGNYHWGWLNLPFNLAVSLRVLQGKLAVAISQTSLAFVSIPHFVLNFLSNLALSRGKIDLISLTPEHEILFNHYLIPQLSEFNLEQVELQNGLFILKG